MAHVTDKYAARDALVSKLIAETEAEMAQRVEARVRDLRMTPTMRAAVERTARKVFRRRKFLILPGNSPTRQRFLKLLLTFAVAHEPRLMDHLDKVARYLSRNYAYEWTLSPVTRLARLRARDMILSNSDSEFGETPLAGALAYVRHHPEEARVEHIANYGEGYTRALRLDQAGFFSARDEQTRHDLGLEAVALSEQALEEKEHRDRAPESSPPVGDHVTA